MDPMKTHGMFSWNELITTDVEAAKQFYGKLLGWTFEDMPMEHLPGMTYSSAKVGGQYVGGMMTFPPAAEGRNIPPHWGAYITVDDTDESAKQCVALGGEVIHGPVDIPHVGRFAVLRDPLGAYIHIITYFPEAGGA
ncbi:VOC family protein [Oceanidesulfovibrio marinus]|uniref:VOC family protein n=1 Tax=Oceanidesulfovibrio marinus TaxID=370038 RepID=A0ABX6NJE3_9BACT|nr:VOC family protein [Oceanidesulfovibrio marinus]QJT10341.1 VOC family protein [Oceanidesulfovibrio marinus]